MTGKTILGLVTPPDLKGAPDLGGDVYLRHMYRTLESQRNVALSAVAEIAAQYGKLSEKYVAHVQQLETEIARLQAELAQRELNASKDVSKKPKSRKSVDKT